MKMHLIRNNWAIIISSVIFALLLLLRIYSHKYSQDTLVSIEMLNSILNNKNTLIYGGAKGWDNGFNYHFNLVYVLLSPIYVLGVSKIIFFWKYLCYGGFLLIIWRHIYWHSAPDITVFQKNLFIIMIAVHPSFISNFLAPDIWDTDLALPLLGASLALVLEKKYHAASFFMMLTFFVKEDMMLIGIFFGVMLVIISKEKKFFWLSIISLLLFLVVTQYIMPSIAVDGRRLGLLKFSFGELGNTMGEVIFNSIFQPSLVITNGLWLRKFTSIFITFLCVAFLPFWRPKSIVFMIPTFGIFSYTIIAQQPYLDFSKHNTLPIFVFCIFASYHALSRTLITFRSLILTVTSVISLLVVVLLQIELRGWSYYFYPTDNMEKLLSVRERHIPENSSVLTGGVGSPWVCYGNKCPIGVDFSNIEIEKAKYEYIIINLKTIFWENLSCNDKGMENNLNALFNNSNYKLLAYDEDIVLLQRSSESNALSEFNWTTDFERFIGMNHDCIKPNFMRELRLK